MFDSVYFVIDDTILNALFSEDKKRAQQVVMFLDFLTFKSWKAKGTEGTCIFCETIPRIFNTIERKITNEELKLRFSNYVYPNSIASPEEGLTLEQEIMDLCNNITLKPEVVLITEDKDKYVPSKSKFGDEYKLKDAINVTGLDKICSWLAEHQEFIEFRKAYGFE